MNEKPINLHDTPGSKKLNSLLNEAEENFNCHKCGSPGYKTDGESKVWCAKCLEKALKKKPIVKGHKTGRNELCICGSGKKFKKCCLGK